MLILTTSQSNTRKLLDKSSFGWDFSFEKGGRLSQPIVWQIPPWNIQQIRDILIVQSLKEMVLAELYEIRILIMSSDDEQVFVHVFWIEFVGIQKFYKRLERFALRSVTQPKFLIGAEVDHSG